MQLLETHIALAQKWPDLIQGEKEIAFIGRSNVGKSSLLNHLMNSNKVAKVSNSPGKTKGLFFYRTSEKLTFVDLPGYGFARVESSLKELWAKHLTEYLSTRPSLLLILLDIRRTPSQEDVEMINWARLNGKTLLFVFTKCDKLKNHEVQTQLKINLQDLEQKTLLKEVVFCLYSIREGACRKQLLHQIHELA